MNKPIKLLAGLCAFAGIAVLVYVAGEMALSDSPLTALLPVAVVLFVVVLYVRLNDKSD